MAGAAAGGRRRGVVQSLNISEQSADLILSDQL